MANEKSAEAPAADGESSQSAPRIITVTGIELSQLPFTVDQIKLAVNELALQIRMEELVSVGQTDPAAAFASVSAGLGAPIMQ